ncbi:MAG TPA: hypothetical protein VMN60_11920 [Longimicrobiales bacterium]|nr:hypothetical protein [Longimicrobiales bacterium]
MTYWATSRARCDVPVQAGLRRAGVIIVLLAAASGACLDPIEPKALPECQRPQADTTAWQRVGRASASVRIPPGFEPVGPNEWALNQTSVALRTASSETNTGEPSERTVTGGCTARIGGHSALVEFAAIDRGASTEHFVVATWRNVRLGATTVNLVFDARTYADSDITLLLAMAWTVHIVELTRPGGF